MLKNHKNKHMTKELRCVTIFQMRKFGLTVNTLKQKKIANLKAKFLACFKFYIL